MKKVRVQEVIRENEACAIRVSDVEFGGNSIKTIWVRQSVCERNAIYALTILNVTEDDNGNITSVWKPIPLFDPNAEPDLSDGDDYV